MVIQLLVHVQVSLHMYISIVNTITIFREEASSAFAGFNSSPLSWLNQNLRCWFLWREENQRTQRKTLKTWREPMTNSTHIGQNRTWATLVTGGEHSHRSAIPAPNSINNGFLQWKTQTCSPVTSLLFPGKFLPQPVDFGS